MAAIAAISAASQLVFRARPLFYAALHSFGEKSRDVGVDVSLRRSRNLALRRHPPETRGTVMTPEIGKSISKFRLIEFLPRFATVGGRS
jgi:hypothetical protein